MSIITTWIPAFRLRTLPLAISSVSLGIGLAEMVKVADLIPGGLCLTTAILLQILSNLANDYGDFARGTDNANRLGNTRALQSGNVSSAQMRTVMIAFVILSLASGVTLLLYATHGELNPAFLLFFIVGLAAIGAAVKYTIGKKAYGYEGLGDYAVFAFFGPVAVLGTFLLCVDLDLSAADGLLLLPASGMGLLCAAVLNTNNIRDIENDAVHGKRTIPVKAGLVVARRYHALLLLGALACFFVYTSVVASFSVVLLQAPATLLLIKNLLNVLRTHPSPLFNRFLKELSIGILLFTFVYLFTLLNAVHTTI